MKAGLISRLISAFLYVLITAPGLNLHAAESSAELKQILSNVVKKLESTQENLNHYGYFQETVLKELEDDGSVSDQKKRTYRIVWIEGEPYAEMIRFNDQELTSKLKKEEQKRREKFIKSLKEEDDADEKEPTWEELYQKYNFRILQSEPPAKYVISFTPKSTKLQERTRMEKIYNNLSGRLWIGSDYYLLRAAATLTKDVRFGLGISGNVQDLEVQYSQQQFQDVWLPAEAHFKYQARIFLINKNRDIFIRFYDPYKRAEASSKK